MWRLAAGDWRSVGRLGGSCTIGSSYTITRETLDPCDGAREGDDPSRRP
jgi:hypothetical protein